MPGMSRPAPPCPPLALYVHLPWCVRKCPYCDFNSYALRGGDGRPGAAVPEDDYVAALLRDLEHDLELVGSRTVQTIFLGGGTPSLFSPRALARLLAGIRDRLALAPKVEITLEANPGTVEDLARLDGYRAAGINRLSLGVQSFDDGALRALGRIHDRQAALAAARAARAAGFENLNLDLMFALPGQRLEQALADLETALAARPTHLSLYELTLEPGTPFYTRPPPDLPDEETAWLMQERLAATLAEAGFSRYEVSNYARPGYECRHNLNYWTYGDYLGLGAGAHAKLTLADGRILRLRKRRQPQAYMAGAGTPAALAERRVLGEEEIAFEFMLNALRLRAGFDESLFTERTGLPLARLAPGLAQAQVRGLIERAGSTIRPSALGYRFLDDLTALFLPPDAALAPSVGMGTAATAPAV
jgi:oxygen-independent coproporphyrinogen-3 oxidase